MSANHDLKPISGLADPNVPKNDRWDDDKKPALTDLCHKAAVAENKSQDPLDRAIADQVK